MAGLSKRRLRDWALTVGTDRRSLEPSRRAAAYGWTAGNPMTSPSALAKQRHLLRVFRARGHSAFVEAGTYRGQTVAFFVPHARTITSVELHPDLYAAAVERFAGVDSVTLVHGDSLVEIPKIVAASPTPPLVFLDGHYSGKGTAQGVELEPAESTLGALAEAAAPGTTIVIDDLRYFGSGQLGFPQLDAITAAARRAFPASVIRTGLDSIVVELP